MKNLKLLNKKYLLVILFYLSFVAIAQSQEPIDIWNIEEKKIDENSIPHKIIQIVVLPKIVSIKCNLKKIMSSR